MSALLAAVEAALHGKDERLVAKCDVPGILAVFELWDIYDVDTLLANLASSFAELQRDLEPVAARSFLALLKATIEAPPPAKRQRTETTLNLKKGPFSPEEDAIYLELLNKHGAPKKKDNPEAWAAFGKAFSYRSPHSWPAHVNAFKKNDSTEKWEEDRRSRHPKTIHA